MDRLSRRRPYGDAAVAARLLRVAPRAEGTPCRCADGNGVGIPDGDAVDFWVPNMNRYASCGLTVEEAETCADAIRRAECAAARGRVGCEPINARNRGPSPASIASTMATSIRPAAVALGLLFGCGASPARPAQSVGGRGEEARRIVAGLVVEREPEDANGVPHGRISLAIERLPEGTHELLVVGRFDGVCGPGDASQRSDLDSFVHCWWAGVGDDVVVVRVGDRVVVRRAAMDEMGSAEPFRDVVGFDVPRGVELKIAKPSERPE